MSLDRKTRGDSKLGDLNPSVQEAVFAHCEPITLAEGVAWLAAEHGVTLSPGRLAAWLAKEREALAVSALVTRLRADRDQAQAIAREAATGDLGDANAALLQQLVFDFLRSGGSDDPKALAGLLQSALKVRDQEIKSRALELDERKVKMLEAKAAQADKAKSVLGSAMSVEEQNRKLREILA